jgi:hypothetical protein
MKDKAQRVIDELKEEEMRPFSAEPLAWCYAGLGDKKEALDWIEKAYENQDPWLIYLKIDPTYNSIRSEPRFKALLSKVGFE